MNLLKIYHLLLINLLICMSSNLVYAQETLEKQPTEIIYDLFSGTISEDKEQLMLNHCTLAKYQYPLHFNHSEDEKRIRKLIKQDPNFWLNLSAHTYEENNKYHLVVNGISEIHLKASCHLTDLLSNLDSPKNTTHQ